MRELTASQDVLDRSQPTDSTTAAACMLDALDPRTVDALAQAVEDLVAQLRRLCSDVLVASRLVEQP